ncbi:flagellar biosynthetic protein FliR [Bordetella sp. N]|uniref:flagellar biosynthetic protein FliR n=1 Tax=Bordetella sp. N TaxID=1746199 RepID=UPI00070C6CC0|nr:flagellar biosynthetic protein FliR [Bordetella sp. N]ALM83184.1 flagellar biosynthetic protein FliR [Bordetella sp. N]
MISFTLDQLYGWINAFLWPFVRLLAMFSVAPLFGESSAPSIPKVGLAAIIAMVVAPTLPAFPAVAPSSYEGLWILAQQVFIGMSLGFVMRIAFSAVQTAGDFVGLQMGLSLATIYDPSTHSNTEVVARLFNMLAMLLFLVFNGHLLMLDVLIRSFTVLPIGHDTLNPAAFMGIAELGGRIFSSGLLLALPLIAALLTLNLALGILNRAAPQLSAFSVGFPITLISGVVLLTVVLPHTPSYLNEFYQDLLAAMARIADTLAAPRGTGS